MNQDNQNIYRTTPARMGKMMAIMLGICLVGGVIFFSMWTEAVKNFAEYGKGNVIFLDGSPDGMERTMKQIQALMVKQAGTSNNPV